MKKDNSATIDKYVKEFEQSGCKYLIGSKSQGVKRLLHNRDRYKFTLNELDLLLKSKRVNSRLLDVGTSPFTFILRRIYPFLDIYSIDYSNAFRKVCKKEGVIFKKIDLNRPITKLGKKKFDIILFLETLEHISFDHREVLRSISASLKVGGYCVLTTPNKYSPKAVFVSSKIINNLWRLFSEDTKTENEFRHQKEYSLNELTELIEENPSFKIISAKHDMFYDTPRSALVYRRHKLTVRLFLYLNYILARLTPPLRRGMVVIFRKIEN